MSAVEDGAARFEQFKASQGRTFDAARKKVDNVDTGTGRPTTIAQVQRDAVKKAADAARAKRVAALEAAKADTEEG